MEHGGQQRERAAEITFETGVIVYDALILALADDSETVVITADGRLPRALEGTAHARLAHLLADVGSLVPDGGLRTVDVLQHWLGRKDYN